MLFTDIILSFTASSYRVNENNGPAQPVLVLSHAIDCCSTISVWVNIEEDTAKGTNFMLFCTHVIFIFNCFTVNTLLILSCNNMLNNVYSV